MIETAVFTVLNTYNALELRNESLKRKTQYHRYVSFPQIPITIVEGIH